MILYSWKKINKAANRRAIEIVRIIDMITYNRVPENYQDPLMRFKGVDFSGQSFLLQPELLLEYKGSVSYKDIAQYVALASYRNVNDYIAFKQLTLDLIKVPVRQELFHNNQLLTIENGVIHFNPEEEKKWH